MFTKVPMLALTAALIALAVPASALATWQHNHSKLQVNAPVEFTGQAMFQGQLGTVECQVVAQGALLKEQKAALVTSFQVDVTANEQVTDNCSVAGGLASIGCTDVASVTADGFSWVAEAAGTTTIVFETGTIQNHLHGGIFCPKTQQLTPGSADITTPTDNTWNEGQLSGQLTAHTSGVESLVQISGTVSITPGGTYGVA